MTTTKEPSRIEADEPVKFYHLVHPRMPNGPLCGDRSLDAALGSLSEHLDDKGQFIRQVFSDGRPVKGCERCLRNFPTLGDATRLYHFLDLQVVIRISPYPKSNQDEFIVQARCISDEYVIEPEPTVIGQHSSGGKVALTLLTHIVPKAAVQRKHEEKRP